MKYSLIIEDIYNYEVEARDAEDAIKKFNEGELKGEFITHKVREVTAVDQQPLTVPFE